MIRVWKDLDLKDVAQHLIVVGELSAECFSCHQVGVESKAVQCPQCQTYFKYMAFRRRREMGYLRKLSGDAPHLTLIDFDDFKLASGKTAARKLLDI